MRFVIGIIFWLACATTGPHASAIDFGRYHALVVGINDYQNLPKLETAVNDASAMHDVLRRDYGFKSTLLLNPTRDQLVRALDEIRATLTQDDNLVIYYAGHGVLDRPTDEGFWLPADAETDSQVAWVPVSAVTRTLRASAAKQVLVIADSCYSGTLTRDAPAVLRTGSDRHAELERLSGKRARKALTSGGLEPVYDGGGDGHSVFTRALLDLLRQNQEVMDGYQLYTKLRASVIKNSEQTPTYADIRNAGDEDGDFLLVPLRQSSAPSAATDQKPETATAVELAYWQAAQGSNDPKDIRAYLERYPNGTFAALARNELDRVGAETSRLTGFAGSWKTDVLEYSDGVTDVHYAFDLIVIGDRLTGKVALVRNSGQSVQKGILDGRLDGNQFSFRTAHKTWHTEFVVDAKGKPHSKRTVINYSIFYVGTLKSDQLQIVRQDERGKPPEELTAHRLPDK